jgi:hypothetical protein
MTEATTDFYLASFAPLEKAVAKNGRAWTQLLRQAAISRFAEPRFPTTRCVAWKHTHVAPTTRISLQPAHRAAPNVPLDALAPAVPEFVGTELGVLNAMTGQSCRDCRCYPSKRRHPITSSSEH